MRIAISKVALGVFSVVINSIVSAADSPRSRIIEEIVVTAQKREENLKEVPISVSAYSGGKLEALGVEDPSDLPRLVPGMTYDSQIGYAIIFMRGLGSDAYLPSADASVATYVDGVYFPFVQNLASDFTKLERLEVLKGPQGTLFGRNSTAGAINIISKSPSDELEASIDYSRGSFDRESLKVFVSGPIIDGVSASLSALRSGESRYHEFTDDSPVKEIPDNETIGLNPRILWDINDTSSLTLSAYYIDKKGGVGSVNRNEDVKPLGTLIGVQEIEEPYKISTNIIADLTNENEVVYGTYRWTPDWFDFKLLASKQEVLTGTKFDFDGGGSNFAYLNGDNQYFDTITSEIQISSKPGGWLSDKLEWTVGYYYYQAEGGFGSLQFDILTPDSSQAGSGPLSVLTLLQAPIIDVLDSLGIPSPDGVALRLTGLVETEAHAAYTQWTWRPSDYFSATIGARYQNEDRGVVAAKTAVRQNNGPDIVVFDHPLREKNNETLSPKIGVNYFPFADDTMIYATFQKANKSGTYNVISLQAAPVYIEPEEQDALEIGLKSFALDGYLDYNIAAYAYEIDNLQTIVVSATSGGIAQLVNVPKAEFWGVDFDLTWELLPETLPGLVMVGSANWLHHEFASYPEGSGFDETTGIYFGSGALVPSAGDRDFTGNKTVRAPDFSGQIGLSYTFSVPGGVAETGASYYYNGGYFFDNQNANEQEAYELVSARLSYLHEDSKVRVSFNGNNLTDEVYYANKLPTDFGVAATFAKPRNYTFSLSWEY